ncbi:MAG: CDGSH iron-sulfur domain-containing protein [Magnetococcales bacterium]|nr:CDGSH iron-sulfur domain-containing protein [Magnetococcales bacterium]
MSGPKVLTLPVGEHWICACGQSKNGHFCDGSHQGTGKSPQPVKMEAAGEVAVCLCGRTGNTPRCDGAHKAL